MMKSFFVLSRVLVAGCLVILVMSSYILVSHIESLSNLHVRTQDSPRLSYNQDGVAMSAQFPAYDEFDESLEANVCFFLQLSESSLALAPRLISRLWHPQNVILVHVDAKVPDSKMVEFKNSLNMPHYQNVHLTPRQSITYLGISMLLNIIDGMEYGLNLESQPWDYFIYLSGSDYPLVSAHNLRVILGQPRILQQQVSFIQLCCGERFWKMLKRYRFDKIHFDEAMGLPPDSIERSKFVHTGQWNPMRSLLKAKFLHSSAFITVHRLFAIEAARSMYGRRLTALLASTKDPEEHFFAMLAWNTKFNRTLARRAGREVFWNPDSQHPRWVDERDETNGEFIFFRNLKRTRSLFTRKFQNPNSPLMDKIDTWISGASTSPNMNSVRSVLVRQRRYALCLADIERHWNSDSFTPCLEKQRSS